MSSSNNAFTLNGAVPKVPTTGLNFGGVTSPFSKALSGATNTSTSAGSFKTLTPTDIAYNSPGSGSSAPVSQGLLAPTSQDVKSHSITNVDGSTVTQTYHPTGQNGMAPTSAPVSQSSSPTGSTSNPAPQSSQNTPSPTYAGLIGSLASKSSQPSQQYTDLTTQAQQAYDQAGKTNQVIGQAESDATHNPEYSLDTGIGRAGQIQQNYGLQGQNALTRASGLGTLAGLANTQQGLQQSGLSSAANLAAPTTQFGVLTDPTTGLPINGKSAEDAAIAGGKIQGLQSAAQTNAATSGTAVTSANASGLQDSIQKEQSLNTAASNATKLSDQVKTALSNSGLQLTNSADANATINNLQSRLGSAAYTQLNIAVNDAKSAYAAILSDMGYTPTDAGNMANSNINSNMSPNQILGAIDQLNQGVFARQQSQHAQTQSYQQNLSQSGGATSAPSGSGGGSLYDF